MAFFDDIFWIIASIFYRKANRYFYIDKNNLFYYLHNSNSENQINTRNTFDLFYNSYNRKFEFSSLNYFVKILRIEIFNMLKFYAI